MHGWLVVEQGTADDDDRDARCKSKGQACRLTGTSSADAWSWSKLGTVARANNHSVQTTTACKQPQHARVSQHLRHSQEGCGALTLLLPCSVCHHHPAARARTWPCCTVIVRRRHRHVLHASILHILHVTCNGSQRALHQELCTVLSVARSATINWLGSAGTMRLPIAVMELMAAGCTKQ